MSCRAKYAVIAICYLRYAVLMLLIVPLVFLLGSSQQQPPPGDPHAQMNHRGAQVMGFDQDKTAHHFLLYEDGGAIDVSVKDARDTKNRDAIRAHLPHIAQMFGQGTFDAPMLVHDTKNVPGAVDLARLKDRVRYKYAETPTGGRVDIVTSDAEALKAVHSFLKFQITDHKTGDALTVRKR
jgi:hypothetical protein